MPCRNFTELSLTPSTPTGHCDTGTPMSAVDVTQTYSGMELVNGAYSNTGSSSGAILHGDSAQIASLVQTGQQAPTQNNMTAEASHPDAENVEVVQACGTVLTYKPILQTHGWVTVGSDANNLPYLIRNGERFIPLSVIESLYLSKYNEPYPEKLGRQPMRGYYLTTEEVRLLNRFVTQNYTQRLGLARFSLKDMLVAILDFVDFYNRLLTASIPQEADHPPPIEEEKPLVEGGWSQVNNTIVPYITRNKVKMVPLSVVRYAARLLCDLDVPSLDVNQEECRYLNKACADEGLDFQFQLNTKLIELFLIPTLSKTRVSIRELPQKEPMQHAKFINRCTDRRSVFVAASVSKSGTTKRRHQRKDSNGRRSSESVKSPVQSLGVQRESHPVAPTNALSASGQLCQGSSLVMASTKESQQETDAYSPVNLTSVLPTQDSAQQDPVVLAEPVTYPPLLPPALTDGNIPLRQPECAICPVSDMSSNQYPALQPNYAAENVFQSNAVLPPPNAVQATLPIALNTSSVQAAPSGMSTMPSITTGPTDLAVPAPLFVTSVAMSASPVQTSAIPTTAISEPFPDALVPERKPIMSPDVINIGLNDDANEAAGNWGQRPRNTLIHPGSVEHENNFNKKFNINTHPNDRLEPYGLYKRQLDILEENGHLFRIKQRKLAERGIVWGSVNSDPLTNPVSLSKFVPQ